MNHKLMLLAGLTFSSLASAASYKPMKVNFDRSTSAEIVEVKLISVKPLNAIDTEVTLGIQALASSCEEYRHLQYLSGQTSLSDLLNPTDHYFRMITEWRPNCATGSSGDPTFHKVTLEYSTMRNGNNAVGAIHHLSFDAGMLQGFNRYMLYRLDLSDLSNVKFEYVKTYSYVEGKVQDM